MVKEVCFQAPQLTVACDVCKQRSSLMHLPLRPIGFYCEKDCPVCSMRGDTNGEVAHRRRGSDERRITYRPYYDRSSLLD